MAACRCFFAHNSKKMFVEVLVACWASTLIMTSKIWIRMVMRLGAIVLGATARERILVGQKLQEARAPTGYFR